jgi:uncharacterized protein (TIGR03067 family)
MDRRRQTIVAIAVWSSPVLLGMALATWIVIPRSPSATNNEPTEERGGADRHRLQGTWEGIRVERDGKIVYRDATASRARVRFVHETVVFEDRDARLEGTFRLDPSRSPKTFDLTVTDRGLSVTYPAGIYQLNGDIFRLCFSFPSSERPAAFETSPGSGRTLFIYRRVRLPDHEPPNEMPAGRAVIRKSIGDGDLMAGR